MNIKPSEPGMVHTLNLNGMRYRWGTGYKWVTTLCIISWCQFDAKLDIMKPQDARLFQAINSSHKHISTHSSLVSNYAFTIKFLPLSPKRAQQQTTLQHNHGDTKNIGPNVNGKIMTNSQTRPMQSKYHKGSDQMNIFRTSPWTYRSQQGKTKVGNQ